MDSLDSTILLDRISALLSYSLEDEETVNWASLAYFLGFIREHETPRPRLGLFEGDFSAYWTEDNSNKVILSFKSSGAVVYLSFMPSIKGRMVQKDTVKMDELPKDIIEQIKSLKTKE